VRHARAALFGLPGACALALLVAQPACARQTGDPVEAWRRGDYDAAIAGFERQTRETGADARTHVALIRVLSEAGRYEDAVAAARDAGSAHEIAVANALGEVLLLLGRADEAQAAFRRSIDGRAGDMVVAQLNLALLDYNAGRVDDALAAFDRFIDIYNGAERLTAEELTAVGLAVEYLGARDPALFRDALRAYDEALAEAGSGGSLPHVVNEPRIRLGELFLGRYNSPDAQATLAEVLRENPNHPRALLGMARAKYFDGTPEALELVNRALEVNPNLVAARVFRARLHVDFEDYDSALEEAGRALEVNPQSLDAHAMVAAVHYLRGDEAKWEEARRRVLGLNPVYADLYNLAADLAVRQRQYAGAVALSRRGLQLDATSWWGWGLLGLNQLRTGNVAEARRSLETAFEGDPYNVWIKNTLDLLDTFDQYREVRSDRFVFMLREGEADLLGPYMTALAEEAYDSLAARYDYNVRTPIRVEVYPSHTDFSVRTVGLAGLGALGVAFGNVLAMDSPSARERGEFNWGSTLWHEIAHAFTLGASNHKVPRWLTEGLAVLEERRAREGWGDDVRAEWLAAYKAKRLHPVSRLNEGFVRPRYPAQIGFSYYQASLVAELIERDHGFEAIRAMLHGYRDGGDDASVFRDVLGMDIESFDERFDDYVEERFGAALRTIHVAAGEDSVAPTLRAPGSGVAGPDDLIAQLSQGRRLFEAGRHEEALPFLERARTLFPENVSGGGPYVMLAEIHRRRGDLREAATSLETLARLDESAYDANLALADLGIELNEPAAAAAALERIVYVHPYEIGLHQRLAELHAQTGDLQGVIRARRAVVALGPVDRAEALYQLALAHFEAGELPAARREVLRALENAPSFARAQELLLRISDGGADLEAAA
jgi:cellulose synthase operon protein C